MEDMMKKWEHKDEWKRYGKDFLVVVSRHSQPRPAGVETFDYCGEHRWCVYAYIYPKHPHFAKFEGDDMWQEAASMMPLHRGPSYLRWHRDANCNPLSVQVGGDYNHHGDDGYTHCATPAEAFSVFRDADELFDWLDRAGKEPA